MQSWRAGGKNTLRRELIKQISESFTKNLEQNIKWKEEYEKHFLGNFEVKPEITRPYGIDRTLNVHARFWFDTWYIATEKIRYMHHKKKRIDKKWSKNPDYYITRSVRREHMPIITAMAV